MLALYDADANALQRGTETAGSGIDETVLYEELLTAFAYREVEKSAEGIPAGELPVLVQQELQRLSLIAFSVINRRRQWVTVAELDADLAALLGQPAAQHSGFRAPLPPGEIALGRFFFIQRAQAVVAGSRLQTFEFLHATFGEYLAARLTVQLAAGLQKRRSPLMVGAAAADDDLLYALLSFAPLSSRQILRFVTSILRRQVAPGDRRELAGLLIDIFAASETRTEHRYSAYCPARLATASRHGTYSANLVLLILALEPALSASRLFRASMPYNDPPGMWHRRVLLWRSAMTEPDWTDLALALSISQTRTDGARDLEIELSGTSSPATEPIDPYWHYGWPPSAPDREKAHWHRAYWDSIFHKMDISSGTNDSAVRHAIEPMFGAIGASITTFNGSADGRASSVAHDLMQLWLSRLHPLGSSELAGLYDRVSLLFDSRSLWDAKMQADTAKLMLDFLQRDAPSLPPGAVIRYLTAAMDLAAPDDTLLQLVLEGTLSALEAGHADDDQRQALTRIASDALAAARATSLPAALRMWITLHRHGAEYAPLFGEDPGTFMAETTGPQIRETHPDLLRHALAIMAAKYPEITL
jgi:hypothetical protein